jgi:cytochrome c oxidase cbb3-type subunit 2
VGDLKNPFTPGDAKIVAEGKALYDEHCAQCHGANLKGDIGVALAELTKSEGEIFSSIYQGLDRLGMPAFGDPLGKEKIWKVITYLSSQKGRK